MDENPKERLKVNKPFMLDKFENEYQKIPNFDKKYEVDNRIIGAFRQFYLGSIEHNEREAFFHYWRSLENLTLVAGDEDADAWDVLYRATSIVDFDEMSNEFGLVAEKLTVDDRIDELVRVRNNLIHEGTDVVVERQDNDFLRAVFYKLMNFMIEKRTESKRDIILWLENADADSEKIERKISGVESNIERQKQKKHVFESIKQYNEQ
jgi:hypothetical protein